MSCKAMSDVRAEGGLAALAVVDVWYRSCSIGGPGNAIAARCEHGVVDILPQTCVVVEIGNRPVKPTIRGHVEHLIGHGFVALHLIPESEAGVDPRHASIW